MTEETKKTLVARIALCAEILAEQKHMLTLEREEYALLADEPWSAFNIAVVVAADEGFRGQIRWVEHVMNQAAGALVLNAITCSYEHYVAPEDRPEMDPPAGVGG